MNAEDFRRLAGRSEDVHGRQADRLTELHARIRTARRRRTALGASVAAGVVIAIVAGGAALGRTTERTQEPVGNPTPTPTPTQTVETPEGQATIRAEIEPGDIQGWELKGSRTNARAGFTGATDLSLTVETGGLSGARPEGQSYVAPFCNGDPDTWWVLTMDIDGDGAGNPDPSDKGTRGYSGPCTHDDPTGVPPPTGAIGDGLPEEAAMAYPLRMFVTDPLPVAAQNCLTRSMDSDSCLTAHRIAPLDDTDTTFGFGVYEHLTAPTVMNVLGGWTFEALAMADGVEYLVDRAVVSASGSPRLVVQMPASDRSRIVAVYATETPALEDCAASLGHRTPQSPKEEAAQFKEFDRRCTTDLELRVDGQLPPTAGPDYRYLGNDGQALLPPGKARTVTVEVIKNDPGYVRYALVIWEARS